MDFIFHDVKQNTDEWFALRSGMLTSSKLGVVMANYGFAFGQPAKNYAIDIANELITGKKVSSNYTNSHMERGSEQEPIAIMCYESETFSKVSNGGFFSSNFVGCSPDGLVGDDGVIEVKSVIPSTHFANIKRQSLDPAYKWQCYGNLKFTGREWLDFISYCQEFPDDKKMFIHRVMKESLKEEFEMIDQRISEFKELVESSKNIILTSKYDNYN